MGWAARHRGTQRTRTPPATRSRLHLCPHSGHEPPSGCCVVDMVDACAYTTTCRNAHRPCNEPKPRTCYADTSADARHFCDPHANAFEDRRRVRASARYGMHVD